MWRSLRRNDDVRCVVPTGAGDEAFCTGIESYRDAVDEVGRGRGSSTPFMFDDPGELIGPKTSDL